MQGHRGSWTGGGRSRRPGCRCARHPQNIPCTSFLSIQPRNARPTCRRACASRLPGARTRRPTKHARTRGRSCCCTRRRTTSRRGASPTARRSGTACERAPLVDAGKRGGPLGPWSSSIQSDGLASAAERILTLAGVWGGRRHTVTKRARSSYTGVAGRNVVAGSTAQGRDNALCRDIDCGRRQCSCSASLGDAARPAQLSIY